jgi:hypothetical protein
MQNCATEMRLVPGVDRRRSRSRRAKQGWGHMPKYLIEEDLRKKRLLDVSGKHLHGGQAELVAARLRAAPHGPVADRLWRYRRKSQHAGRSDRLKGGQCSNFEKVSASACQLFRS